MQRFTLIHDGSEQGWQTAYLAFHIAAQLGAPLLALLVNAATDQKLLVQRATQVEVGGRAAGVAIKTRLVNDFSLDTLIWNTHAIDGLFLPRRFIPDRETVLRWMDVLSCPLWVVSKDSETYEMAVLVEDYAADESMIHYTTTLSQRLQQTLTGLIRQLEFGMIPATDTSVAWIPLADFSALAVTTALNQLEADLLFLPVTSFSLAEKIPLNFVVYPGPRGA